MMSQFKAGYIDTRQAFWYTFFIENEYPLIIYRLKLLNHQLNQLVQLADQQKKKCLRYKIMLEIRCSDLEKAESEVYVCYFFSFLCV